MYTVGWMAGYVWTNPKNEQINNIAELPFLTGYDTNNCLVVSIPQPPTKPRFCFSWMGFARNLFDKSTSCFIVFPLVLQPPQTRPITQMKPTRIEQQMRIKEGKYLGRQQAIPLGYQTPKMVGSFVEIYFSGRLWWPGVLVLSTAVACCTSGRERCTTRPPGSITSHLAELSLSSLHPAITFFYSLWPHHKPVRPSVSPRASSTGARCMHITLL